MKRLFLLRHGRAEPGADDALRPLAERGLQDIERLGRFLAHQNLMPTTILCSTSLRTRQTVATLTAGWPKAPQSFFLPDLYLAETETILSALRHDGDAYPREGGADLMLVGHNPGLGQCARHLAGQSGRDMADGFPTSALALFAIADGPWQSWDGHTAQLERFIRRGDLYEDV